MKDFAAIDFETANGKRTSVCSVGVVVVRGGEVVDTFYRLIRPRPNFYSHFTTRYKTFYRRNFAFEFDNTDYKRIPDIE